MNLFTKFFKPKTVQKTVQKSLGFNILVPNSAYFSNIGTTILPRKAIQYYDGVASISTAIDLIAEEIENIRILILNKNADKDTDKFIDKHVLLDLLNHPNSDQTRREFLGQITHNYMITGNAFIGATGDINKPPLELISISPIEITIQGTTKDTFPEKYIYLTPGIGGVTFKRQEDKKNRLIFVSQNSNGIEGQLWHIRGFNTETGLNGLWGKSKLNSIFLEIEQIDNANRHNLSFLEKGMRSSAFVTSETSLTQDQRDSLREQLTQNYAGADNAGRIFFADGGKFNVTELSKTMKDMDFRGLREDMKIDVFNRLKVPLPLVTTESQTFVNMREAKLSLYDNAVIPLLNLLLQELTLFLFPRYNLDTSQLMLAFNPLEIQALRQRIREENNEIKDIKTINEQRADEILDEQDGGDVIYQPVNLVPLGTNPLLQVSPLTTADKQKMIDSILLNQILETGERLYPDMAIKKI